MYRKMESIRQCEFEGNNKLIKILFYMIQTIIQLRKNTKNHIVDYDDKLKRSPRGNLIKLCLSLERISSLKRLFTLSHI